ncbi:MAG: hypothetical protein MUF18_07305 [Fimbriiglobus sp.]|jgi:hypothetical protein|nr:hypothetical protein [Fimbriiglobus sp.]
MVDTEPETVANPDGGTRFPGGRQTQAPADDDSAPSYIPKPVTLETLMEVVCVIGQYWMETVELLE